MSQVLYDDGYCLSRHPRSLFCFHITKRVGYLSERDKIRIGCMFNVVFDKDHFKHGFDEMSLLIPTET